MSVYSHAFQVSGELKEWEYSSDSGEKHIAYFCPDCGNRIYHEHLEKKGIIHLKPGTLDDTSILEPDVHLWVKRKQPWVNIPEGIPRHDTQPDDLMATLKLKDNR